LLRTVGTRRKLPIFAPVIRRTPLRRAIAGVHPWVVLAIGWVVVVIYAYPGQLTFDSLRYFVQARAGEYSDDQPPAIAALWRLLEYLVAGPCLMLVVQVTAFLAGLYLIFQRSLRPRPAACAATAVIVFPPVMVTMAMIWKDSLTASFLALGAGLLLSAHRRARVAGLASLCAASAFHYAAPVATLPLVVILFEYAPCATPLRRYAIAALAWVAITLLSLGLDHELADHQVHGWSSTVVVHDIVGTLAYIDEDLPDEKLKTLFAGTGLQVEEEIHERARELYNPRDFVSTIGDPQLAMWKRSLTGEPPAPHDQRKAIEAARRTLIHEYPKAYLKHRIAVFAEVLSRGGSVPNRVVADKDGRQILGLSTRNSDLQLAVTKWFANLDRNTALFVPGLYLVVSLILLGFARREREVLAILCSGLAMEGAVFFIATSRDFRHSLWMVVCMLVATITLIVRRAARAR